MLYAVRSTPYATGSDVNLRAYFCCWMTLLAWNTAVKVFYNIATDFTAVSYGRKLFITLRGHKIFGIIGSIECYFETYENEFTH